MVAVLPSKENPLETSDIGHADYAGQAPREYEAWACGCHMPVTEGSTGTSASGWVIRQKGRATALQTKEIASKDANRRAREAGIMAAFGVVEFVESGCTVIIRMNDRELIATINRNFVNTNGKPSAGKEHWGQLQEVRQTRGLNLSAVPAERGDEVMADLVARVQVVARARLEELGPTKAMSGAVASKSKASKFPEFTAVDGDEAPLPPMIHRKSLYDGE